MNPKIAFFGTPKIAAEVLEKVASSIYKPQLVITGHDRKLGRGLALEPTSVKLVAQKHKIAISYEMSTLDKSFDLAILVAYGHIIPDEVLRMPRFGFVNVHPSLLPKYRGPSPIVTAILNGDRITGVTLIVLDSELDHGPIIAQEETGIVSSDTNNSLATKLAGLGSKLLLQTLPDYLAENITPIAQDHSLATYTEKITKDSGKIDTNNPPDPGQLDRMVRAYHPWPGAWAEIEGKRMKLLPNLPTTLPSYHPANPFLVQLEGKKPITLKEFTNGYPRLAGKITNLLPV